MHRGEEAGRRRPEGNFRGKFLCDFVGTGGNACSAGTLRSGWRRTASLNLTHLSHPQLTVHSSVRAVRVLSLCTGTWSLDPGGEALGVRGLTQSWSSLRAHLCSAGSKDLRLLRLQGLVPTRMLNGQGCRHRPGFSPRVDRRWSETRGHGSRGGCVRWWGRIWSRAGADSASPVRDDGRYWDLLVSPSRCHGEQSARPWSFKLWSGMLLTNCRRHHGALCL